MGFKNSLKKVCCFILKVILALYSFPTGNSWMLVEASPSISTISNMLMTPVQNRIQSSCATIQLQRSSIQEIQLYQNTYIDRTAFSIVREQKSLLNATILVGTKSANYSLEICGFGYDIFNFFGNCYKVLTPSNGSAILAPPEVYKDHFEVTSLGCGCNGTGVGGYCPGDCSMIDPVIRWSGELCAIMFQEYACSSCYFSPISLSNAQHFQSFNSYQVKTMIVRPGCRVERATRGKYSFTDETGPPKITNYTGIVDDTYPVYNKDSENFTCFCAVDPAPSPSNSIDYIIAIGCIVIIGVSVCGVIRLKFCKARDTDDEEVIITPNDPQEEDEINPPTPPPTNSEVSQQSTFMEPEPDSPTHLYVITATVQSPKVAFRRRLEHAESRNSLQQTPASSSNSNLIPGRENFLDVYREQFHDVCPEKFIVQKEEVKITKANWENPLGQGAFGNVYFCRLLLKESKKQGIHAAVKMIKWPRAEQVDTIVQSFLREIRTLANIGAENEYVIRFFGACCHKGGIYILTEYCAGGFLKLHLVEKLRPKYFPKKGTDPEVQAGCEEDHAVPAIAKRQSEPPSSVEAADRCQLISWCEQIACGMDYLWNEDRIIHADLAARNMLLTDKKVIKICDFGLSRKCLSDEYFARTLLEDNFPFHSMAPEWCKEDANDPKTASLYVDIWAYGLLLWEIFSLGKPIYSFLFEADKRTLDKFEAVRKSILRGDRHPKPKLAEEHEYEMIHKCWEEEGHRRPRFSELREFFEQERKKMKVVPNGTASLTYANVD